MDYIYTLSHIITITTEFTFEELIFLLPPTLSLEEVLH